MRSVPCISAIDCCSVWRCPPRCGAQEKKLSGDEVPTDKGVLVIHPINHASFLMQFDGKTIYADPVGGAKPYTGLPKPDLVLVTHIHGDHFDPATLAAIVPGRKSADDHRAGQRRREDSRGPKEPGPR